MAVRSPFPDINIPEVSLAEFILNEAKCFSDRIAFIDDATGRTMTFTEFNDDVNKLAKGLHAIGLEKNDVIALCLPNMIEYIVVTYVGMKKIFSNANPRYIFALPDMLETVKNASSSCSSVQEIFIVERNIDGDKSYDELLRLGKDQVLPAIEIVPKDDAAMLVYTSGSTGDRKAAVNTHRNLVANTLQISYPRISPFSGNDVSIALRPMSHGYGLSMYMTSGLYNGCRLIFLEDYGTESLMKAIDKYKVAPRELEDIIQDLPGVDSVVVVGVPDEEYQELAKAFVIKQPGSSLTEDDVIKVVQESLERKRWLHGGVEFVETLPKTPSGKVLRRLVKENLVMKKKKGN
ncbi:hypothetical protein LSH36_459g02007 [Paralvinella palmiformis]|uniref:Uncharacterized protein n=1 Tax=Paralvinella palmiformis TaxID=53620 RepID=A0AAD9JA08_9ANNE|nr:hypothetical protein LSH36_459g02007 [Paralvinella palmiformis]